MCVTGNLSKFIVDTSKAGSGALAVTVDGPSKVQLQCDEVSEGYQFTYSPTSPGDYLVIIKYAGDAHIPGSPFKARVTGNGIVHIRAINRYCYNVEIYRHLVGSKDK